MSARQPTAAASGDDASELLSGELPVDPEPAVDLDDMFTEAAIPDGEPSLFAAIRYNNLSMIGETLRSGFDIDTKFTDGEYQLQAITLAHRLRMTHYAALHLAVLHAKHKIIDDLLAHGADINIRDGKQRTPVHLAVVASRLSVIEALATKGAEINARSSSGRSPLLEAVISDKLDIARALVDLGANIDIQDTQGTSVLQHTCFKRQPDLDFIQLLLSKKCDVNIRGFSGCTPLMFVSEFQRLDVAKLLIAHGANINQKDAKGMTPVYFCTDHKTRRPDYLLYLIHQGADLNISVKQDRSLLDMAMTNSSLQTILTLLFCDVSREASVVMDNTYMQYVFERLPEFRDRLVKELYTPRTLQRLCREKIRTCLSSEGPARVMDLDLPRTLQDFVLCRDIQPEDVAV
ncbi:serine/threonine-protein phosphatase 6 regulatory ankyrin repeat subunit A-like isoform X2 [Dreissena polymorpha]|nr:serine/threonine-protein phosphatase 6 regulatory ankyrin repeat subunit A-like isoform X2 [Dreissena polymorpha]